MSPYVRTEQAASYLGLAKSTLEKKRLTGDGPRYSKPGGIIVYAIEDLDAWVAENRRQSTSAPQRRERPSEAPANA